jgi:hypothetical protein
MLSVLLLLLALCSKEIALIWLVLFTLHTLGFERTPLRSRLVPIASLLVVLAFYLWLHSLPPPRPPQPSISSEPLAARSIIALRALGDYTGLLAFPATLMMERSLGPVGMYANTHTWQRAIGSEWLSILGLAAILVTAWLCAQRGAGASCQAGGSMANCSQRQRGAVRFLSRFIRAEACGDAVVVYAPTCNNVLGRTCNKHTYFLLARRLVQSK